MPFAASKPFCLRGRGERLRGGRADSMAFAWKSGMLVQTSGNAALPSTALFGMKPSGIMLAERRDVIGVLHERGLVDGDLALRMPRNWPTL